MRSAEMLKHMRHLFSEVVDTTGAETALWVLLFHGYLTTSYVLVDTPLMSLLIY